VGGGVVICWLFRVLYFLFHRACCSCNVGLSWRCVSMWNSCSLCVVDYWECKKNIVSHDEINCEL
jgi:hypothetical protein